MILPRRIWNFRPSGLGRPLGYVSEKTGSLDRKQCAHGVSTGKSTLISSSDIMDGLPRRQLKDLNKNFSSYQHSTELKSHAWSYLPIQHVYCPKESLLRLPGHISLMKTIRDGYMSSSSNIRICSISSILAHQIASYQAETRNVLPRSWLQWSS